MAGTMSEGELQLLDLEDLASAINELYDGGNLVRIEDLKNIQSEKAIEIYKLLLFALYPGASEQISLIPVTEFAIAVKNPCLYEDSITLLGLSNVLSRVFQACCVHNFGFRDLVAPKPKRTHRLLSSLVNYLRFCSSKQSVVDDAFSQANAIKESAEEREQIRNEKLRRIEELELMKAEERRELARLKPESDMKRSLYNEMTQQKIATHLNERMQDCNVTNTNLTKKTETEKQSAVDVQAVAEKSTLVDILIVEDKIKEATDVTVEQTSLLNKLSFKGCKLRDLEEDCETALNLISGLAGALGKHKEVAKRLESTKERVRVKEQELTDLIAGIQNARRQQTIKNERFSRLQSQNHNRKTAKLEDMEREKKKRTELKTEINVKIREEIAEVEAEKNEVSELISLQHFELEEKMKKAAEVYGHILDQLDIYHQSLATGFGTVIDGVSLERSY